MWLKTFHYFLQAYEYMLSQCVCVSSLAVIYPASFLSITTGETNTASGNITSRIPRKGPEPKISGIHVTNDTCWCLTQRICKGIFIGMGVCLCKVEFLRGGGLCLHSLFFALTWHDYLNACVWDTEFFWKHTEQHRIRLYMLAIPLLNIYSYKLPWKECLIFKIQPQRLVKK